MKQQIDLLILNAAEVITCASPDGPRRGAALADPGRISEGAVAIDNGSIVAVGDTAELESRFSGRETIDAAGRSIVPGFVDSHTHTIFAGDRAAEFELRIAGASYMEIMAAGGGILNTVSQTREASVAELMNAARPRLDTMLALGSTTIEIKSGYGLDTHTELKMLEVIARLDQTHPADLVPTFLGAHTVPEEYKGDTAGYVDLVVEEMIPAVNRWYEASHFYKQGTPLFIDVFCEDHAFDVEQTLRILKAGAAVGMRPKLHVDQFNELGALGPALDLKAASVDHLEVTGPAGIAQLSQSDTIGVVLPAVNFNLGLTEFANARALIDQGGALALATDLNPGSAPCYSLPLVMAVACRYQKLRPAESLQAATINGAHAIGLGDQIGSIEAGKQADLLLLHEKDYRFIPYFMGGNPVATVIKKGRLL